MTKMAATPIYDKSFQNRLQNRKSCDFETWHASSGTQVLQIYINDDPGLTLTYFTARSNWSPIRLNGKNVTKPFNWGKLASKDWID